MELNSIAIGVILIPSFYLHLYLLIISVKLWGEILDFREKESKDLNNYSSITPGMTMNKDLHSPLFAKSNAVAFPIPVFAPVIITVLPTILS